MNRSGEKINLGLSMFGHGYHYSAWLHPQAELYAPISWQYYKNLADIAERGFFDLVFLADLLFFPMTNVPEGALGRRGDSAGLDPLLLLASLATHTKHIGLVATSSTTFSQPYHVARSFASLDQLSEGRSGWNVVTSTDDEEARNFGSNSILNKSSRYERAEEFVDVVAGLWDSFDSDSFMADRKSGIYFDAQKIRPLNHSGNNFMVKGPLNVPRSPQGRPIIFQAGASEAGQQLAARSADVVYSLQTDLTTAKSFYKQLKSQLSSFGRDSADLKIMPGLLPIIGESQQDAARRYTELQKMVDPYVGLEYLSGYFGNLSGYPLDEAFPDFEINDEMPSRKKSLTEIARQEKYSIRQLFQSISVSNAHKIVVGTPSMIADFIEQWFFEYAADGFNILPAVSPNSLVDFVDQVVPELQRRGIFRDRYMGKTLRDHLQLPSVLAGEKLPPRRH